MMLGGGRLTLVALRPSRAFIHTKRNPFAMDDEEVEDVCKLAGLDYEPEKEEEIEFVTMSNEKVIVVD
jgi:hypothetical protein